MIENTIEQKEIFIAKYWGQKVFNTGLNENPAKVSGFIINNCTNKKVGFLQLTPLSMITDEHAIEVFKIHGGAIYSDFGILTIESPAEKLRNFISTQIYFRNDVADYLRSKGYYVGDGTEVTFGWAVLITS